MERLTAYDKVKLTRKPDRAATSDYVKGLIDNFTELHGDRRFGDDRAVIGGVGMLGDIPVTVIGTEKGKDFNDRVMRNFGCALPEGYRKALRLVKEAEKFHRPVLLLVDIQGANCGKGAEERGVAEAIAENLYEFGTVKTPMISLVIGEGGSGGALALSVADEIWMLEHAYYSVIAPESCASILFKEPSRAGEVAEYLKLTAADLYGLGAVEKVVTEPSDFTDGGECAAFMSTLKSDLINAYSRLLKLSDKKLLAARYEKFRKLGRYGQYA